jgi:hypothetical protein
LEHEITVLEGEISVAKFSYTDRRTFKKIKCQFFMAYYYKMKKNQDKVVSHLHMFEDNPAHPPTKAMHHFQETGNHVIDRHVIIRRLIKPIQRRNG